MITKEKTISRTDHLVELMTKGDDAFNNRDHTTLDVIHHPDMIAYVTGDAQPIYGRNSHANFMNQFVRMFPDAHVHTPYPIHFGSGDWITVITNVTGTFTGEMKLPGGNIVPPTGKKFDVEFAQTTKWKGDQLIEIAAFWDAVLLAQQIGLSKS